VKTGGVGFRASVPVFIEGDWSKGGWVVGTEQRKKGEGTKLVGEKMGGLPFFPKGINHYKGIDKKNPTRKWKGCGKKRHSANKEVIVLVALYKRERRRLKERGKNRKKRLTTKKRVRRCLLLGEKGKWPK